MSNSHKKIFFVTVHFLHNFNFREVVKQLNNYTNNNIIIFKTLLIYTT